MAKLLLLDGNSVASRAFYALPLLSNSRGVYTNAVLGFATMLLRILDEERPDYIACVFDAGKITFRHELYQDYKGKRQKTPPELSGQFPLIKQLVEAFSIPVYELENYEADDIMGTFARQAKEKSIETGLISGDKDTFQLINDSVKVYYTKKGISDMEIIDELALYEKYQLKPEQMIDLKGLMGDASDNIPGVPGVGEKTALKLLYEYDDLETVLDNIENIKGKKLQERLTEFNNQAVMSKKLATINNDVPLTIDWEKTKNKEFDKQKLLPLFQELEFKQLIDRLDIEINNMANISSDDDDNLVNIDENCYQVAGDWHSFDAKEAIAVAIELDGDSYHDAQLLCLALVQAEKRILLHKEQINEPEFKKWLINQNLQVSDSKTISYVLRKLGIELNVGNIAADIMLMDYLLDPTSGKKQLADLAQENGISLQAEDVIYGKNRKLFTQVDLTDINTYTVQKAIAIANLADDMWQKVQEYQQQHLLLDVELPLALILSKMEYHGIKVEASVLEKIGEQLIVRIEQVSREIWEIAGEKFNLNSPKQMSYILFEKLELPPIKKTKTGYSTDAEVLEKLAGQHEVAEKILLHRQLDKLYSTYVVGLLKVINQDTGKIHTIYNQTLTATGRLSSVEPNLQNIPIRLDEGRQIRKAFIASEQGWRLLAADYSQIELRILAHMAKDEKLVEAFQDGVDIHTRTASEVFAVPLTDVDARMRRDAKAVNFGIIYGISDYGLSQNLGISRKRAKEYIEKYFANFPGVKKYMDGIIQTARKQGYVQTLLHRRRYLPDIKSSNFNLRSFAERMAMNTPIQGTAADIIKLAMVKIDQEMQKKALKSRMLLQVHDELIFEVPNNEWTIMLTLVPQVMASCIKLSVPLIVDINGGDNWYEAK